MSTNYKITQNAQGHFVLSNDKTVHNVCPCCDKPIFDRPTAEALARNLQKLDKEIGEIS